MVGGTDDTQENLWTWFSSNVTITHGKDQYTYKNFKTDPTYDVTNNCLEKTTAGTWSAATCSTTK